MVHLRYRMEDITTNVTVVCVGEMVSFLSVPFFPLYQKSHVF